MIAALQRRGITAEERIDELRIDLRPPGPA